MYFKDKRIHFVGIGGVSMSALARLVEHDGAIISGSDANGAVLGVPTHNANNIKADFDLVVINGAISDDNPELVRSRELGIAVMGREQLLAEIESCYTERIAVAGSHGKSTTTAMIAAVLSAGGLKPTVHNGAYAVAPTLPNEDTNSDSVMAGGDDTAGNLIIGAKKFFVTEACEFKRSFLRLSPTVAVITNIDFDHVDCFKDMTEIKSAFNEFAAKAKIVFYGESVDATEYAKGKYSFKLDDTTIKLNVVGRHNADNAMLAARVGLHFGIPIEIIRSALENFKGIARRFQVVGEMNINKSDVCSGDKNETGAQIDGNKCKTATFVSDYAHHPAEIETTIKTATSLYGKDKFLIVFQPHTYTRTLALFDDFVRVLSVAPCVLYKTFAAREKPRKGGTARDLAKALGKRYFATPESLRKYLARKSEYSAIILTGAGNIDKVAL